MSAGNDESLEPIRAIWLQDRPQYERLVTYLRQRVEDLLKQTGVWAASPVVQKTWTAS